MCYNPITIRNKAYTTLGGFSHVQVPCGHCDDCLATKQIDYFLRAYCMATSLPETWSLWFCTFTFAPEHLPQSQYAYYSRRDFTDTLGNIVDTEYTWIKSDQKYPCFNHSLLRRFLKSFNQYYTRKGLSSIQYLFTCEFGSKKGRPHYHAIIAVPERYPSWTAFSDLVNNYWHYGFTYNCQISHLDGIDQERSISTAIKYVTKYVCKSAYECPFYLNHREIILTDYEPYQYRPRVFTSNGFGSHLASKLTDLNYKLGKVTLSIDGKPKTYSIPNYILRRYFTHANIVSKEKVTLKDYWHPDGVTRIRYKVKTEYLHGYKDILRKRAETRFVKAYQTASKHCYCPITEQQYVAYKMLDYDAGLQSPYIHRKHYIYDIDPLNSACMDMDSIYKGKYPYVVEPCTSDCSNVIEDTSYLNSIRHQVAIERMKSPNYNIYEVLHNIDYISADCQSRNNKRKCELALNNRSNERNFYSEHLISAPE